MFTLFSRHLPSPLDISIALVTLVNLQYSFHTGPALVSRLNFVYKSEGCPDKQTAAMMQRKPKCLLPVLPHLSSVKIGTYNQGNENSTAASNFPPFYFFFSFLSPFLPRLFPPPLPNSTFLKYCFGSRRFWKTLPMKFRQKLSPSSITKTEALSY